MPNRSTLIVLLAATVSSGAGAAQDRRDPPPLGERPATALQPAAPEKPGRAHARLDILVGRWDAQVTMFNGDEPVRSSGVSRYHWVLEDPGDRRGRFLRQELRADLRTSPFQGLAYWGHDNHSNVYTSVWMDSLNTSAIFSTGAYDPEQHAFTLRGKCTTPTGAPEQVRMVLSIENDDRHTLSVFNTAADADERLSLQIIYTRTSAIPADDAERRRDRQQEQRREGESPAATGGPR
jgi:hypothetical protein